MAVALHTYILDDSGAVVARITTWADTDEEAADIAGEIIDGEFDGWDIEVLEERVSVPDAAEMRTVEKEQGRAEPDEEEPEEEGDGEEEEEEEIET
jgi:hypothetical protein